MTDDPLNYSNQLPYREWQSRFSDSGQRRHLSWGMQFDTRPVTLNIEIGETSDKKVKRLTEANKRRIVEGLIFSYGVEDFETKIQNFKENGEVPFSKISYALDIFIQCRDAYVSKNYYPALVGACALGERILNHMIIDLRDSFSSTNEYKKIYRKQSFQDWRLMISTLASWEQLLDSAKDNFEKLEELRHYSVHYNADLYNSLKDKASSAINLIRSILNDQFGTHSPAPWFISGTRGHVFIKREYEDHPFVRKFLIPGSPFVGPNFAMERTQAGFKFLDVQYNECADWSDKEFAEAYNNRDPKNLADLSNARFL